MKLTWWNVVRMLKCGSNTTLDISLDCHGQTRVCKKCLFSACTLLCSMPPIFSATVISGLLFHLKGQSGESQRLKRGNRSGRYPWTEIDVLCFLETGRGISNSQNAKRYQSITVWGREGCKVKNITPCSPALVHDNLEIASPAVWTNSNQTWFVYYGAINA